MEEVRRYRPGQVRFRIKYIYIIIWTAVETPQKHWWVQVGLRCQGSKRLHPKGNELYMVGGGVFLFLLGVTKGVLFGNQIWTKSGGSGTMV